MSPTPKPTLVAVIGVGLVGTELISQLLNLAKPNPFKLVSLSSSKLTVFDANGLLSKSDLTTHANAAPLYLADLSKKLASLVEADQRVVIIENTSSEEVAGLYPTWLASGISVITPNKKAYSGEYALYEEIVGAATKTGARFLNEATVGAGLPIMGTLKDLVATGDKVVKIEGVFSGTMSYIFNEFSNGEATGPAFSDVVSIAREKGYTEPHPGDDLNGADVARKLTILSRAIPELRSVLSSGYKSVDTASLVPSALASIASGDEFIQRLPELDAQFDEMRKEAAAAGQVLRYVGVVDVKSGQIKASLEKYSKSHPFATSLGGSDNIVMFHTERYSPRPLIVQGAGAGAAVTAMGVMSDLLKLV